MPPAAATQSAQSALAKLPTIVHKRGIVTACRDVPYGCGCSSAVEHDLAKVGVEGSIPFARSNFPYLNEAMAKAGRVVDVLLAQSADTKGTRLSRALAETSQTPATVVARCAFAD